MAQRLFGVETEYAVSGLDHNGRSVDRRLVLRKLMELARERHPHLLDGSGRGVFFANGARFYVDFPDHPEFSSPECTNPWDVVRYLRAGDRILGDLAEELPEREARLAEVVAVRSNVDYLAGTTWGSHSSYLHQADPRILPRQLIPFLVSRIVFAGAGGFNSRTSCAAAFTLSPRAWHLECEVSPDSTSSRGIYHTKNEPLAREGFHRLHVLCGESLASDLGAFLRIGTTALVVALIESGERPGEEVRLAAPLAALQCFASDPTCRAKAEGPRGARSALDIQRHYLEQVEAHLDAEVMPEWAERVCVVWRETLDRLQMGAEAVATRLDWAIKLALFKSHTRRRGVAWQTLDDWSFVAASLGQTLAKMEGAGRTLTAEMVSSPRSPVAADVRRLAPHLRNKGLHWDEFPRFIALRDELFELDMRFAQLGAQSLFAAIEAQGVLQHNVDGVDNVAHAVAEAPTGSRASLRGRYVRELSGQGERYVADWSGIFDCQARRSVDLGDPFASAAGWGPWRTRQLERLQISLGLYQGIDLD